MKSLQIRSFFGLTLTGFTLMSQHCQAENFCVCEVTVCQSVNYINIGNNCINITIPNIDSKTCTSNCTQQATILKSKYPGSTVETSVHYSPLAASICNTAKRKQCPVQDSIRTVD